MALAQADVVALARSWVVRIWLVALLLSFLVVPVAMVFGKGAGSTPASAALAAYLAIFLNVWSIVIIVLSAGSVSLESEIVADSILSRACTRTQYILAKLTSRALVVGAVYLLGASAAAYVSWRYGAADVTFTTVATGIAIVGLALLMLVSLGVTISAVFDNTTISIVGLLLLWHVAGAVFAFAGVEYMSPTSLTGRLPEILRDSRAPRVVSCSATRTSVSITFSKDLNPASAEDLSNYTVEDASGSRHVPQTAVYDAATATVRLSGLSPEVSEAVTVTVDGVTDSAGNGVSPGANEATAGPPPAATRGKSGSAPDDGAPPESSGEGEGADREGKGVSATAGPTAAGPRRAPACPMLPVTLCGTGAVTGRVEGDPASAAAKATILAARLTAPASGPATRVAQADTDGAAEGGRPAAGESGGGIAAAEGQEEPGNARDDEVQPPSTVTGAERDARQPPSRPQPAPAAPDRSPGERAVGGAANGVAPSPAEASPRPAPVVTQDQTPARPAGAPTPPAAQPMPGPSGGGGVPVPPADGAAQPARTGGKPSGRLPRVTRVTATRATVSVAFSQDMEPAEAEELANYAVESPPGTVRLPRTGAYDPSQRTVLLSGLSLAPGDPVKVTVQSIRNRSGARIDPRHNSGTFSEVQTWKYLIGFGAPALLFALVGVIYFSWRDL